MNVETKPDLSLEGRWGAYLASLPPEHRRDAHDRVEARVGLQAPADTVEEEKAPRLDFDFDAPPEAPAYVVDGLFEAETVDILTADTGAGKSWLAMDLTVAAIEGREWLGRAVHTEQVLYIDEENPRRVPKARLRALGATNARRDKLYYTSRRGVQLGADEWNYWLQQRIISHGAGLVFIDTAMAATVAEANENDSVVKLYHALRPIASNTGAAIVLLHHERKQFSGQSKSRSEAALGARQWVGQADMQMTGRLLRHERTPRDDGGFDLRTELTIEGAKTREDIPDPPELVAITSVKSDTGKLLRAEVRAEGQIERETSRKDELVAHIAEVIGDECETDRPHLSTAEIAAEVGCEADDGTFKSALRASHTGKRAAVEKIDRGKYAPRGGNGRGGLSVD